MRSFLKLQFVNGVKWSWSIPSVDFCKFSVKSHLLVALKEQGLTRPTPAGATRTNDTKSHVKHVTGVRHHDVQNQGAT